MGNSGWGNSGSQEPLQSRFRDEVLLMGLRQRSSVPTGIWPVAGHPGHRRPNEDKRGKERQYAPAGLARNCGPARPSTAAKWHAAEDTPGKARTHTAREDTPLPHALSGTPRKARPGTVTPGQKGPIRAGGTQNEDIINIRRGLLWALECGHTKGRAVVTDCVSVAGCDAIDEPVLPWSGGLCMCRRVKCNAMHRITRRAGTLIRANPR
jgi:hypothetical protein